VRGHTLRAEGVGLTRAGRRILNDVSAFFEAGEVTAVTGPSGSGKTSLLFVLSGLVPPDRGRVLLDDRDLRTVGHADLAPIAFMPQTYGLSASLNAHENVAVALQARGVRGGELDERTDAAMESVGLAGMGNHLVDELSGGQRQRLAVARALVTEPEVLVADEPTAELDAANRALVLGLLLEAAERGALVVLSTHDPDVTEACGRVLGIADGELVEPALH
jgi:putative ABC transport system ATP-binding protein